MDLNSKSSNRPDSPFLQVLGRLFGRTLRIYGRLPVTCKHDRHSGTEASVGGKGRKTHPVIILSFSQSSYLWGVFSQVT